MNHHALTATAACETKRDYRDYQEADRAIGSSHPSANLGDRSHIHTSRTIEQLQKAVAFLREINVRTFGPAPRPLPDSNTKAGSQTEPDNMRANLFRKFGQIEELLQELAVEIDILNSNL